MTAYQGDFDAGTASANVDGILEFFEYWFGDIMTGTIEVGWKDTETGKLNQFKRFDVGDIDECAEFCAETNAVPGQNIYFRPCLIKEDAPKFVTDKDAIIAPGIWVDLDDEGKAAQAKNIYSTCQPTSITVTGREPWTRAQLFWKFTEQAGASELIQNLNKSAQIKLQGDPAVTNVSTLMRVPATISWPWKQGRKVEQVESIIRHDRPKLTWARIQNAFPMPEKEERKEAEFFDDGEYEGLDPQEHLRAIDKGDQLHVNTRDLVAHMVGAGYPDWLIKQLTERALKPVSDGGTLSQVPAFIDSARTKYNQPDPGVAKEAAPVGEIKATPLGVLDRTKIPRRPWILKTQLLEGYLSAIIAPPGVGKSTLTIQMGIAIALQDKFAGWDVKKNGKVWIFNNEDDRDELHRRVIAAADQMGVTEYDIADKLFVDTGAETPLLIAKADSTGDVIYTPQVNQIIQHMKQNDIKVLIVDPFAETHSVQENNNDQVKQVATKYRYIAQQTGAAVLIVHHTRKAPSGDNTGQAGNADTARGGGALVGVTRVVSTLFNMSAKDAEQCGVDLNQRHLYVRYDDAKANLSLITHEAVWFKRHGMEIGNEEGLEESDVVGTLEPVDFTEQIRAAEEAAKAEQIQDAQVIARVMREQGFDSIRVNHLVPLVQKTSETESRRAIEDAIPEAPDHVAVTFDEKKYRLHRIKKRPATVFMLRVPE